MKKTLILLIGLLCYLSTHTIIAQIADVEEADPSYKAMQKTITEGYFSLDEDNNYNPKKAVTRKEAALILDKLGSNTQYKNINLTKTEIQELNQLAKTFKGNISSTDEILKRIAAKNAELEVEQDTIHNDMTKLNWELKQELAEMKKQRQYLWLGIGLATFLGVVVH